MVSIEKWKEHFRCIAQKGHMHEDDIFIVNQSGCGSGRNVYPKCTLYKVRKTIGGTTPITIVSPVAGNLDRARALMKGGGGGKRKKKTYKKRRQRLKVSERKKLPRRRQLTERLLKKGEKEESYKEKKRLHTFPSVLKKRIWQQYIPRQQLFLMVN